MCGESPKSEVSQTHRPTLEATLHHQQGPAMRRVTCAWCPAASKISSLLRLDVPSRSYLLALSPASTSPAPASCPCSRPLFYGPPLPRALSASWHMPCKLSCNAAHLCNAAHMQCSTPFGQRCSCCGLVLRPARAGMGWTLSLNRCPQGLVVRGNMSP